VDETESVPMQRPVQLIFLALIATFLLPFAWRTAEPFLTALFLAIILAVLLEPVRAWLVRKLGRPRLAALLTTAFAAVLVAVTLWMVGAVLAQQVEARIRLPGAVGKRLMGNGGLPGRRPHSGSGGLPHTRGRCCGA
jgi:predicted PurR-regulated permease PerM